MILHVTSRRLTVAVMALMVLAIFATGCSDKGPDSLGTAATGGGSKPDGNVADLAISVCLADFKADGWHDTGGGVFEGAHPRARDYTYQARDFAAAPTKVELTAADRANGIEEQWDVEVNFVSRYKGPTVVPAGAWTEWGDAIYYLALRRRSGQWERAENYFQRSFGNWVSASGGIRGGCADYY